MKLKFILSKIKIQKNLELFFVLLLILMSIAITNIYNSSREISKREYMFELTIEQRKQLLQYLWTRPYGEVATIIAMLVSLKDKKQNNTVTPKK